jgi:hypothetical protein
LIYNLFSNTSGWVSNSRLVSKWDELSRICKVAALLSIDLYAEAFLAIKWLFCTWITRVVSNTTEEIVCAIKVVSIKVDEEIVTLCMGRSSEAHPR